MTAFTSAQTGNWNDGATWGKDSPGVKGTDWPGLAGDTASVTNGHTVTYNVSETNEMGQVDVAGKLSFDDAGDRLLTLAHQDLNVTAVGELEIGTAIAEFDAAQVAKILWSTTGDNAKGLIVANGGKLTIYGASDYCTVYEDTLANDAENTDGDAVIKTVTDMSADWHVGDELTIKVENAGDTTSYIDAVKRAVIQSFDGGDGKLITLDVNITAAAAVGDTWTSSVVNVTRNVQLGKLNADVDCGDGSAHVNTNRPKFTDANASGNNNCFFSYAMATGLYSIDSDNEFQFLHSTARNGYYGFYAGNGHTVSGNVYANIYGLRDGNGHTVSGNVYANTYGFRDGGNHTVSGNVYANAYGFFAGNGHTVSGRIGYDSDDVSQPNVVLDFYHPIAEGSFVFLNAKMPLAGLGLTRNDAVYATQMFCEHHDGTAQAQKIYGAFGDVVKVACDGAGDQPSVDPDAGHGYCIELSNVQSLCSAANPLTAWRPYQYRIWATSAAGVKTYTFKVQTTYSGIAEGGLKLTAKYLDELAGGHLGEETDDSAINVRANDADWTQTLAVSVTPAQDGWIDFMVKLMEYQSGDEVWIWPVLGIS